MTLWCLTLFHFQKYSIEVTPFISTTGYRQGGGGVMGVYGFPSTADWWSFNSACVVIMKLKRILCCTISLPESGCVFIFMAALVRQLKINLFTDWLQSTSMRLINRTREDDDLSNPNPSHIHHQISHSVDNCFSLADFRVRSVFILFFIHDKSFIKQINWRSVGLMVHINLL